MYKKINWCFFSALTILNKVNNALYYCREDKLRSYIGNARFSFKSVTVSDNEQPFSCTMTGIWEGIITVPTFLMNFIFSLSQVDIIIVNTDIFIWHGVWLWFGSFRLASELLCVHSWDAVHVLSKNFVWPS